MSIERVQSRSVHLKKNHILSDLLIETYTQSHRYPYVHKDTHKFINHPKTSGKKKPIFK